MVQYRDTSVGRLVFPSREITQNTISGKQNATNSLTRFVD